MLKLIITSKEEKERRIKEENIINSLGELGNSEIGYISKYISNRIRDNEKGYIREREKRLRDKRSKR